MLQSVPAGQRFDLGGRGSTPRRPPATPPAAQRGAWELTRSQKMAAVNTRTDLKNSPMGVSGRAAHLPPPATGGRYREAAADEAHLSGFLESGHTKNSSSAGSKARGSSSVFSLWSADRCDPDPCRHLLATADGGARVLRSAKASLPHAALSMVGSQPLPLTTLLQAQPRKQLLARPAGQPGPAPRCSANSAPTCGS